MNVPALRPSHDAIARRAYDLYLERGQSGGDPMHDWLRAEAELSAELSDAREEAAPAPPASSIPARRSRQAAPRKPRARMAATATTPAETRPRARGSRIPDPGSRQR